MLTLTSRSASALARSIAPALARLQAQHGGSPSSSHSGSGAGTSTSTSSANEHEGVLLFALSKNSPSQLISTVLSQVKTLSSSSASSSSSTRTLTSIGALVEPAQLEGEPRDRASSSARRQRGQAYSLALAYVPRARSFVSSPTERAPIALGREILSSPDSSRRRRGHTSGESGESEQRRERREGEQEDAREIERRLDDEMRRDVDVKTSVKDLLSGAWRRSSTSASDGEREQAIRFASEEQGMRAREAKAVAILVASSPSRPQHERLLDAVSRHFPRAAIAGLCASSTPFVEFSNGQPFTLFHNGTQLSTGAVGLALLPPASTASTSASQPRTTFDVSRAGLHQLGAPLRASVARGNIVTSFAASADDDSGEGEGENAARVVLKRVQALFVQHKIEQPLTMPSAAPMHSHSLSSERYTSANDLPSERGAGAESLTAASRERSHAQAQKDYDIFAAIHSPRATRDDLEDASKATAIVRVLSGDPSRGTVSFDANASIDKGDQIVLYYRDPHAPPPSSSTAPRDASAALSFHVTVPSDDVLSTAAEIDQAADEAVRETNAFVVGSENGVFVQGADAALWHCTLGGATVALKLE